jgi:hypothetical protein
VHLAHRSRSIRKELNPLLAGDDIELFFVAEWTEERRYEVLLIQLGEARLRDRKSHMEILSDSGWVRFVAEIYFNPRLRSGQSCSVFEEPVPVN